MAARSKLDTLLFLSNKRSYFITPEGSTCPIKLTKAQRSSVTDSWRTIQPLYRIGRHTGTLYARP